MSDRDNPETESTSDEQPKPQLTQAQVKRLSQPMVAMLFTVLLTVAAVVIFIGLNPEPDVTYERDENVGQAAQSTAEVTEYAPLDPDLPDGWTANYARYEVRPEQEVPVWEVGYLTPDRDFIGFAQTDEANPGWINAESEQAQETGTRTVDGLVFETRGGQGDRQHFILGEESNSVDGTTLVISGDASEEEFDVALDAFVEALGVEPEGDAQ